MGSTVDPSQALPELAEKKNGVRDDHKLQLEVCVPHGILMRNNWSPQPPLLGDKQKNESEEDFHARVMMWTVFEEVGCQQCIQAKNKLFDATLIKGEQSIAGLGEQLTANTLSMCSKILLNFKGSESPQGPGRDPMNIEFPNMETAAEGKKGLTDQSIQGILRPSSASQHQWARVTKEGCMHVKWHVGIHIYI